MDQPRDLILFVDDQLVARKYFSLMFSAEYEVLTASNAEEAWALVRKHEDRLTVVVTDQRMPNMSGVDLLMAVRRKHPRIVRLLTTGYADLGEAIDAVNRGEIYAYIHKPWNIEEFGLDLRRAVALYHLQQERDSLLGLHASAQRHLLYTDRLHTYSLIAATCSGWIEGPPSATLAFWSDSMRHFLRSAPRSSTTKPWGDVQDQERKLMASAARLGSWLAANRDRCSAVVVDAAKITQRAAKACGARFTEQQLAVNIPLDQRFFEAGLCSMFRFLEVVATWTDSDPSPELALAEAASGGLNITLRITSQGAAGGRGPCDLIEAECLGLQAYFAIHHHDGSVAIKDWGPSGGVVTIHMPSCPATARPAADTRSIAATSRR